ncbi:amidohydrolase family protein [Pseudonocardia halophobica]|uniref:2-amino-3-carboxymuconate-6-semialdehyde decarboxylase n=1 Tax=Pseudonocardia halophobica TaxID=29401 RepID=A0A9W6UBW0_9PSEU|nr:amidohydrolase family protein [Pseudonocardia halophobica]GLL15530.1 amidohydrolase [Pseudonocardia halophobica]
MSEPTAVDVHAHHFSLGACPGTGAGAPALVDDGDGRGRILRDGEVFRVVTDTLWRTAPRLAEMDRAGVSHQVVSPVPVAMEYAAEPAAPAAYAAWTNDGIADVCAEAGGRLYGLGCLPTAEPGVALAELYRCLRLGLRGLEVGTRIGALELDDPELEPLWAACEDADLAVFVHPLDGGRGVVRRTGQPYDLGLGMLTDTAIAATGLIFGGVLERHPGLRVALAHGGGAFAWAYPRLRVAASRGADPGAVQRWDAAASRLFVDTLVFDDEHLRLLVHRFGADRLVIGSDLPFFPDQLAESVCAVRRSSGNALPAGTDLAALAANAEMFLGLRRSA